jgi:hypothetical protein
MQGSVFVQVQFQRVLPMEPLFSEINQKATNVEDFRSTVQTRETNSNTLLFRNCGRITSNGFSPGVEALDFRGNYKLPLFNMRP